MYQKFYVYFFFNSILNFNFLKINYNTKSIIFIIMFYYIQTTNSLKMYFKQFLFQNLILISFIKNYLFSHLIFSLQ